MTEEQEDQVAMFLRMAEILRNNGHLWKEDSPMKKRALQFKESMNEILTSLTDNDWNRVLDRYKEEWKNLSGSEEGQA